MEGLLLVLGFVLIGLLVLAAVRGGTSQKRKPLDKLFVKQRWSEINSTAARPDQSARLVIIEADKLLDYVLKNRGYRGETMGERLKNARADFTYNDDVWQAHKLRNKLVHEAEAETDQRLIKRALGQFRQALKDLGAL